MIDHADARVTVHKNERADEGEPPWVARYEPLDADGRTRAGNTPEIRLDARESNAAMVEAEERLDIAGAGWEPNPEGGYRALVDVADGLATIINDEPQLRLLIQPRTGRDPQTPYLADPVVDVALPDDDAATIDRVLATHGWRDLPGEWEPHDYGSSHRVARA